NLSVLPFSYTLLITLDLPYIKSILKTFNDHADYWFDELSVKYNTKEVHLKEDYDKLDDLYITALSEKEKYKREYFTNTFSLNADQGGVQNTLENNYLSLYTTAL
ncbi:MAG TPA: hypothetical protein VK796_04620, partial [Cytophaga sp.]|nr:hypothetical protein [Cytophaga sp.]